MSKELEEVNKQIALLIYKRMHRAVMGLPILGEFIYKLLLDIAIGYGPGKKPVDGINLRYYH